MARLCRLPPGSTSGPAVGGAGSLQRRQLLTSQSVFSPFLPSLPPPVLAAGSEVLSCVRPLSRQREIWGESSDSGEDLCFLLHLDECIPW